jgi:signal transduction histidine kinase
VRLTSGLGQPHGSSLEDLQIRRQRIDLCTVLSRAAETVSSEIAQRRHQISLDLPEAGIWVFGDAGRLEEVFINLLSNASKYSDVGTSIATSVHVADGHVEVQVCDSGIGIAADSLPHIFDLFVRAESMSVRSRPGLGIGLALVRSIVETHCGTVSAASAGLGQGSKFTVRLEVLS